MAFLVARRTTYDALSGNQKSAVKKASSVLELGDPALFTNPSNVVHYVWDDPRIGEGKSWVDAAPPGLFDVYLWGLPVGWNPYNEA